MILKLLVILSFFIFAWNNESIIVNWDQNLIGDTQVYCTVDGIYSNPVPLELENVSWVGDLWIKYHPFLEPFYSVNCMGFLDGEPVTDTLEDNVYFPNANLIFLPLMKGVK